MNDTLPPLTDCAPTDIRARPLYDAASVREAIQQAVEAEREAFRSQVANDAQAMTFQTMGQYRTALLQFICSRSKA